MKLVLAADRYGFAGEHYMLGISASIVSAIAFGSMFVPIKRRNLGDGVFVQWIQCAAILMCGIFMLVVRLFPRFSPPTMLAGCLWAIGVLSKPLCYHIMAAGNMLTIPIVNRLGIGLGNMVRGSVQIVVGWATARFGLMGLAQEPPHSDFLEYFGVTLTVLWFDRALRLTCTHFSAVLFAMVEPHVDEDDEKSMLLDQLQFNQSVSFEAKFRQ